VSFTREKTEETVERERENKSRRVIRERTRKKPDNEVHIGMGNLYGLRLPTFREIERFLHKC
jgi:hypothetical protein